MVNFGLNSASILGIFLAVAGASLYFVRTIRPELSRDQDIFFAAVGLLCGFILVFNGWRMDPILQFGQLLLTGSVIFFAVETIRLRGVATEQARRSTPTVDRERPVSRTNVYRAELEQLEPYEEEEDDYERRSLKGSMDRGSNRSSSYDREEPRNYRRSASERPERTERPISRDNKRPRRPNRENIPPRDDRYSSWEGTQDAWGEEPAVDRRRTSRSPETTSRSPKRRSRPSREERSYNRESEATPADYVDYQPIDREDRDSQWNSTEEQPKPDRSTDRSRETRDTGENSPNFDY